jgi:hypothetical protein
MPDVHAGKGCTIGTTMTVKDKAVLASGDPDQIMSGATNQILSEKSEPI